MKTFAIVKNISLAIQGTLLAALLAAPCRSAGQVSLSWVPSGTNLTLQWPVTADNYMLEVSTNLTDPAGWTPAPTDLTVLSSPSSPMGYALSTPGLILDGNCFFRLHQFNLPLSSSLPQILQQPVSAVVPEGTMTTTFTVVVTGPPDLTYQWMREDGTGTFFPLSGQNAPQLVLPAAGIFDDGARFLCLLGSGGVSTFSEVATLRVVPAAGATVTGWGEPACAAPPDTIGMAFGSYHGLALTSSGMVVGWGDNSAGQINIPSQAYTGAVAVAAGGLHSLALLNDGTVAAWGDDDYGESDVPPGLSSVVQIAAGEGYSLALGNDGTITAWGDDTYGQTNVPSGLDNVLGVAAGDLHGLALLADGSVAAWGDNSLGQTNVPAGLSGVRALAAGGYHSLALLNDGNVVAWGDDSFGQCDVPTNLCNVTAIAAGETHSLALLQDGTVMAWGDDTYGQTNVAAGLTNINEIAAGGWQSAALAWNFATTLPPLAVAGINATAGTNVLTITFNEPLEYSSATISSNYFVFSGSRTIPVQSVSPLGSSAVTLILGSSLLTGTNSGLAVFGVNNLAGSAISPVSIPFSATTPQMPCPGGTLLGRQTYPECNADGFWHVVEDDYYQCPPSGDVTTFRVADVQTTQPCSSSLPAPSPLGLLYLSAAEASPTCGSPAPVGLINVSECLNGWWSNDTYLQYQFPGGMSYLSGPTASVLLNPPTPCDQPPPAPPAPQ